MFIDSVFLEVPVFNIVAIYLLDKHVSLHNFFSERHKFSEFCSNLRMSSTVYVT
jgi:hypothetical protein